MLNFFQNKNKNLIHEAWKKLSTIPKGNYLFSKFLARLVPYSSTIPFTVLELGNGHCKVSMPDSRKVRNHLNSVHAIAIANLGELATGLALVEALPPRARSILTGIEVNYLKKARGVLCARATFAMPELGPHQVINVSGEVLNSAGEVVAKIVAVWMVDSV